jgi:hypothetical protein
MHRNKQTLSRQCLKYKSSTPNRSASQLFWLAVDLCIDLGTNARQQTLQALCSKVWGLVNSGAYHAAAQRSPLPPAAFRCATPETVHRRDSWFGRFELAVVLVAMLPYCLGEATLSKENCTAILPTDDEAAQEHEHLEPCMLRQQP